VCLGEARSVDVQRQAIPQFLPNNQEVSLNVCVGRQPSCEVVTIAATERGRKGGMQFFSFNPMFKVFILVLLGTLLCYFLADGRKSWHLPFVEVLSSNADSINNEIGNAGGISVTPVLESVLRAHNLDSTVVEKLMKKYGLDEASLLQLLADVGQTAALALHSKSD